MELEGILTIGVITAFVSIGTIGIYSFIKEEKAWDANRERLYKVMDSVPEEHRVSVGRVLKTLVAQHPHENVSYRIKNLLQKYNIN